MNGNVNIQLIQGRFLIVCVTHASTLVSASIKSVKTEHPSVVIVMCVCVCSFRVCTPDRKVPQADPPAPRAEEQNVHTGRVFSSTSCSDQEQTCCLFVS